MSTSRTPAAIDALLAAFTATGLETYDGPVVSGTTRPGQYAVVGGTDSPDDDASESAYGWAGLGAKARNQEGRVTCCVVVQSGDTDVKTLRDAVHVLLATVEAAITTDPTLGGAVSSGQFLITEDHLTQRQTTEGAYARITFTVTFTARI